MDHRILTPEESLQISQSRNEEKPRTTTSIILRPGMMKKGRALIAAGLVGMGGGMASGDVEAQQFNFSVNLGQNNSNMIGQNNSNTIGQALAVNLGARLIHQAMAPQKLPPQFSPDAVQVLQSLGLSYSSLPFSIYNGNGTFKLNLPDNGNQQLSLRVEKENENSVVVTSVYLDRTQNNRKMIQRSIIGSVYDPQTKTSKLVAFEIGKQPL